MVSSHAVGNLIRSCKQNSYINWKESANCKKKFNQDGQHGGVNIMRLLGMQPVEILLVYSVSFAKDTTTFGCG
jgi:hypothetical protein